MQVAALIAASGEGQRMGGETKKQYLLLDGVPILARTLKIFESCQAVGQIVVVVPPGDINFARDLIKPFCSLEKSIFVEGGNRRQDSVYLGLQAVSPEVEIVCIHDGVRPFVSNELIENVLQAAIRWGAAVPVIPETDTLKEISISGMICRTISRETVRRVQTPQMFRRNLIVEAYRKSQILGVEATDDAYLLELLGENICAVAGSPANIKITHPLDLLFAEAILKGGQ
ncbi:MAG: 2-C-methyl-D-erythritol 4-phosphate cytidylyltransferase [Dethiobacteria bacterium]|jgi:2-C-methyl-D-erythritol 4-phosphate cytidylyltransferase|nr:2-C-methyl-D-erythritol 4-phosphate cytidylyltransferase [Bacillota bacterium]HOJ83347.1 2-C-methyl-D-erythritol 4-phosphate cytidylyltransferase [Bacillota bacterium]HOL15673.1 2-C-methyl-D-erythritol 4-phosphate cytidylyltransferase [Bacillota bacterium]